MAIQDYIYLITTLIFILAGVGGILWAIIRGDIKKLIIKKMEEAEEIYKDLEKPEKSIKKLEYVVKAVSDEYKLVKLFINVKAFISKIIDISKQINK